MIRDFIFQIISLSKNTSKAVNFQSTISIFGKTVFMETKKPERKKESKPVIQSSKSVSTLFGINKKELDGLEFQKKVRNEWQ